MSNIPSSTTAPIDAEQGAVPFAFEELFFSRTDDRGIIQSGNSVFQRISLYDWDGLLRKPHNIIRHPDMPKAVFWLLWDTIKRGEPIGAYVKNRAKDGRHYWVFAIVTPVEDGYLSVRLKPSSPVFDLVQDEYKKLLNVEISQKLKPAESGALLLKRLAELGFPDYPSFMAYALAQEITARDENLRRRKNRALALFGELVESSQSLLKESNQIFESYSQTQYVPLNLKIQAAQLQESGATISVISDNYSIISNEIKSGMNAFITSAAEVSHTINGGLFLVATSSIQKEVLGCFQNEPVHEGASREEEMNRLSGQAAAYGRKAIEGLRSIMERAQRFQHACVEMKRLASALQVTRVMGKVESSRLTVAKDGLNGLIDDLENFQVTISEGLKELERINRLIQFNTSQLLQEAS